MPLLPLPQSHDPRAQPDSDSFWRDPRTRRIVSVLLFLHLVAIASVPLAMHPASPLCVGTWRLFRPYLDAFYLNHGFHFFAPDPGPSHLIRFELDFDDGQHSEGVFPNPQVQTPRLLYHRHFMLSEEANRLAVDDSRTDALKSLTQSFADHLLATHNASKVRLFLRRHFIPTPEQVSGGMSLDAPELYAERPLGEFIRAEPETLEPETTAPERTDGMFQDEMSSGGRFEKT